MCFCVMWGHVCTCMCVHVFVWVPMCTYTHVEARGQPQVSTPGDVHLACLYRISHWDLVELTLLRWLDHDSQGPTCLHSPSAEITKCIAPFWATLCDFVLNPPPTYSNEYCIPKLGTKHCQRQEASHYFQVHPGPRLFLIFLTPFPAGFSFLP